LCCQFTVSWRKIFKLKAALLIARIVNSVSCQEPILLFVLTRFQIINLKIEQWGAFYLFIANFFATQIIGGAKELVVLL